MGGWGLVGVSGVLDPMKIRLTQPQVEFDLGLSLAKIQHSLRNTFLGRPLSFIFLPLKMVKFSLFAL